MCTTRPIARFINNNAQTLTANSKILFTSNKINSSFITYLPTGEIQLKMPGTYMIYTNFDAAPTGSGTAVQIVMYEGEVQALGANGSASADAGDTSNIAFNTIVTAKPSIAGTYATISFRATLAESITNANVIVEKIG